MFSDFQRTETWVLEVPKCLCSLLNFNLFFVLIPSKLQVWNVSSELLCGNNECFTPSQESSAKHWHGEGAVGVQGASPAWAAPRGSLWRCRDAPVLHMEKLMGAALKCSTFGFSLTCPDNRSTGRTNTELRRKISEAHFKVNSCSNPSGFYSICLKIFCLGDRE